MPIKPVIAESRGWRGMFAGHSDEPQPGLAHYLLNCRPWDARFPSPIGSRQGIQQMGGVATSTILAVFAFWTSTATYIIGRLVQDAGAGGAHIDTFVWNDLPPGMGTWTTVVAASVLNAAGVTAGIETHWVEFNGQVVFSDGTNLPWTWNGTGAGGVTSLTNAPIAYGKPTVYYGCLFFLQASDRLTLLWSEVNTPNTGYVAGGFNDSWVLNQTGGDRLVAILGTNTALYYWRTHSTGALSGAPGVNFSNTGVHDAVSGSIGCGDFRSVVRAGFDIWFMDTESRVYWFPEGGYPTDVTPFPNFIDGPEPFGYDSTLSATLWTPGNNTAGLMARAVAFTQAPQTGPGSGSAQVWFALTRGGNATGVGPSMLVYDAGTHLPQGYYVFPLANAPYAGVTAVRHTLSAVDTLVIGATGAGVGGNNPTLMFAPSAGDQSGAVDISYTSPTFSKVGYTSALIDGPMHSTVDVEAIVDRQDIDAYHQTSTPSDDSVTFGMSCVSSQFQNASAAPAALNQVLTPAGVTGLPTHESHLAYGVQSIGHWFRAVITWNNWISGSTVLFGAGVKSIRVTAYPEAREPAMV